MGNRGESASIPFYGAYHFAAAHIGRHFFQQFHTAPQHARPGCSIDFMAGKRVEISTQRLDVRLAMYDALGPVNHQKGSVRMADIRQLSDRIDYAKYVGYLRNAADTGAGGKYFLQSEGNDRPIVFDW